MPRKPSVKKVVKKGAKKIAKGAGRGPAKQVKLVQPAAIRSLRSVVGWLYVRPGKAVALVQPPGDTAALLRITGGVGPMSLEHNREVAALAATAAAAPPEDVTQRFIPLTYREGKLAFAVLNKVGTPVRFSLTMVKLAEKGRVFAASSARRAVVGRQSRTMVDALCNVALGR